MTTVQRFNVRLTPRASRDEIAGIEPDETVKIRLTAPPVEGAANKSLVKFLAKQLGIRASSVRIVSGLKSRNKVVEVAGAEKACWQKLFPDR